MSITVSIVIYVCCWNKSDINILTLSDKILLVKKKQIMFVFYQIIFAF